MNTTTGSMLEAVDDRKVTLLGITAVALGTVLSGYAISTSQGNPTGNIVGAETTEQTSADNDTRLHADSTEQLTISREEMNLTAQELIDDGFMPSNTTIRQPRPYTVNGTSVVIGDGGIRLMIQQDPAYPNGVDRNGTPIIPDDLTTQQRQTYINVLYGDDLNWKEEARNPQNSTTVLGGCIYCNAPAGAGGCYKKQVLRGLVYTLTKKGWTEKQIRREATVWMKSIFGGDPFMAWGIYYKQTRKDPSTITATLDTLSQYGRAAVGAKLAGTNITQVTGTQACGT